MPIRHLLVGMGDLEQCLFVEVFANELHTNGHALGETSGESEGRDACGICRDNINIREVHFERVAGLLAKFEGCSGTGRGEEKVTG